MNRKAVTLTITLMLAGCAAPEMAEDSQRELTSLYYSAGICFDAGHINAQDRVLIENSSLYILGEYQVSDEIIADERVNTFQYAESKSADEIRDICRQLTYHGQKIVNEADSIRRQKAADAALARELFKPPQQTTTNCRNTATGVRCTSDTW
jgi:hypothetical protein